jgi:hypothetical protein
MSLWGRGVKMKRTRKEEDLAKTTAEFRKKAKRDIEEARQRAQHEAQLIIESAGEAEKKEVKMKKLIKRMGITGICLAVLILVSIVTIAYAYTAITVTSQVEVEEPISIVLADGDGSFDAETNIWDMGTIYPLDAPSITITFANDAEGAITLSLSANPASFDGDNLIFIFDNDTVEVPAGGIASVTLTADTTQSLAPGAYSTEIIIER